MKRLILPLIGLLVFVCQAQEFRFKKGTIIDEVPMVTDSTASYALYLPQNFVMSQKWPLLFVFDPEGNGRRAVGVFKEVAEEYGIIIVASNSIKNDLLEKNVPKFYKLSTEIAKTFPIQNTRIFTAGYSGGARLATTIAVITRKIEAVIACGASFYADPAYYPKNRDFYFIGIAGEYDFNYLEMQSAQAYLNDKKISNELFVFNGGHEWPDAPVIAKAFKWIQFGYQRKYKQLPPEEIKTRYLQDLQLANKAVVNDKEKAIRHLNRIRENYKLVLDTDSLKKKIRMLKKDPLYKLKRKKDQLAILEEDDLRSMYAVYFEDDLKRVNFDNLGWWESQLKQIDSFTKSKDYFKARTSKRIKGLLFTAAREVTMALRDSTDTKKWLYGNIFATLANEEYVPAYFNIIQYGARKLDYDMALYYTEELFKNGFTNLEKLYKIEGASLFFVSPAYLELEAEYFLEEKDNFQ